MKWLRRRGYLDDAPLEARSHEPHAQTALEACAAVAMGRGKVLTVSRDGEDDDSRGDTDRRPDRPVMTFERDGFNVHAGVRIAAGDDLGRERLCRYGARPPLSLERLRRLPGGCVGYRLKYVDRGRKSKHRVMSTIEFMARLAAIIAPPRYPLVRYGGVLAPRSAWRRHVVPRPRERAADCKPAGRSAPAAPTPPEAPEASRSHMVIGDVAAPIRPGDVIPDAPNVIAVKHWDRLLGGLLYAVSPRIDWATLLRRSFHVDVLQCPRCHGRLRVIAVITEREPVRRILTHLGLPTGAPPIARARDPTDDDLDAGRAGQLSLGLA